MANFLHNICNKHFIANMWVWAMICPLWIQYMTNVLPLLLPCFMQCIDIFSLWLVATIRYSFSENTVNSHYHWFFICCCRVSLQNRAIVEISDMFTMILWPHNCTINSHCLMHDYSYVVLLLWIIHLLSSMLDTRLWWCGDLDVLCTLLSPCLKRWNTFNLPVIWTPWCWYKVLRLHLCKKY